MRVDPRGVRTMAMARRSPSMGHRSTRPRLVRRSMEPVMAAVLTPHSSAKALMLGGGSSVQAERMSACWGVILCRRSVLQARRIDGSRLWVMVTRVESGLLAATPEWRCLCRSLYYTFGQMAKKIVFPIRLTDAQAQWIVKSAGKTPPTRWAREYLLQKAPKEIREDRGEPLKKKS